jgi:hypothetical protein
VQLFLAGLKGGMLADEAALYGVPGKVRDLGLPLVSVRRVERVA